MQKKNNKNRKLKTTRLRANLCTIDKNGLYTNSSKTDGITFCGGALT